MRRTMSLIAAMVAVAGIAPMAAAQAPDQDVRCWVVANLFAKVEKDPQKRQLALVISYYYLGRADARLSPPQLKNIANAQGKLLKQDTIPATMNDCVGRMRNRELALRALATPPKAK